MSPEKLLLFLVMLSVLVALHEYGHFLLARRNGVRVDDFALVTLQCRVQRFVRRNGGG